MANKRDYYEVLGVARQAPRDEVKRAYRRLAKQYHPDMAQGMSKKEAEERFKELSEAYEVLSDDEKRGLYDQYGHAGVDQQVWGGQGFDWSRFTRYRDVEDIFGRDFFDQFFQGFGLGGGLFDEFFGRGRGATRGRSTSRGSDLRLDLNVGLKEVAMGGKRAVEIPHGIACSDCGGSGAAGGKLTTCPACGGSGQVSKVQRRGFGQLVTISTCDRCGGRGQWPERPCKICGGKGVTRTVTKMEVDIPRGAPDNLHLRVPGKGEPGNAGPGDLYIILHVQEETPFRREGNDLIIEVPISYPMAVLGGEVEVPTLQGSARVKIPPGTQAGTVLRLRGKGLPDLEGEQGDELVKVTIVIPTDLSEEERLLLERLLELGGNATPKESFIRRHG